MLNEDNDVVWIGVVVATAVHFGHFVVGSILVRKTKGASLADFGASDTATWVPAGLPHFVPSLTRNYAATPHFWPSLVDNTIAPVPLTTNLVTLLHFFVHLDSIELVSLTTPRWPLTHFRPSSVVDKTAEDSTENVHVSGFDD